MRKNIAHMVACGALLASSLLAAAHSLAQDLVVGQIGSLTEKPVPEVVQLGEGMKALFAAVNERGGINGKRIDFFQLDDALDPDRFVARFAEAMKRKPIALLSPYGSPAVQRMLSDKLLDNADVVVLNAVPGAEAFRKPGHAKLFHVRAGDGQQIQRITQHIKTLGIARLGVLYVDAPGGSSGYSAVVDAASQLGGLQVTGAKAPLTPEGIDEAARSLLQAGVQSTLVIGPPKFMATGVAAMRKAGGTQAIFTMSYLSPAELVARAGGSAKGVGVAQAFPNPMGVTMPLQREFQAAMRKAFPDLKTYSAFHMEGYICAKLFAEVARKMKRPSAAEFAKTLASMGEVNLGGFRVDFSGGSAGSRFVDIAVMSEDGRLRY
ncbi:ABC transporter substrate-binding protein [Polaromonas sp.]|uniref:ABC transporter substrate-binding protein n=1 Tax=Polaromonas sp. TaxID=1869339 RepID=UPI0025DD3686|nr:ABC transporter substrate-binding protein [Polaromonas sp.]